MPFKKIATSILFFTLALVALKFVNAQQPTRNQLEVRKANLLKEIAAAEQQLAATKKDRTATLAQLRAIQAKLNARQKLISGINEEIAAIDGSIQKSSQEIDQLNKTLEYLKKRYAESVRYAYKNRESQNMLAFLFSANDFNDAMRRMQYLKKYRDYRKGEAERIVGTQIQMQEEITRLNNQKQEKNELLVGEEQQRKEILTETQETNKVIEELKGREGELMAIIRKNQAANKKIEASIKEQIRKELEIAKKKAAEEEARRQLEIAKRKSEEEARRKSEEIAKKKAAEEEAKRKAIANHTSEEGGSVYGSGTQPIRLNTGTPVAPKENTVTTAKGNEPTEKPTENIASTTNRTISEPTKSTYKLSLTPEVQALSENFASNQGKLPWPVEKGFVSGPYGKYPHPLYKSVTMENNGIDISTAAGSPVRAVFEGVVTKVANIDGSVMVMISHGEYFTVYTKLAQALVKSGDKINVKQVIGRVGTNEEGLDMVNFQIWKITGNDFATVNPTNWIAR